jgi:non-specific protein-tyrosine kinase
VVISPAAREGKTFVATNLAITLAQSGSRVLLVDADLRRPVIHRVFRISDAVGLVDALRRAVRQPSGLSAGQPETAFVSDSVATPIPGLVASNIDNLWLLPAGTPVRNPSELLSSDYLGQMLETLAQQWDTVVLDSAPIGTVADTLLLAQHASACMLVARWGRTRRAALGGAIAALRSVGRPLVGVVLNDERPGPLARFSRDDYYQHGYWSEIPSAEPPDGTEAWQSDLIGHALNATTVVDPATLDAGGGSLRTESPIRRPRRSPHGRAE